jgi:hypothetical protein
MCPKAHFHPSGGSHQRIKHYARTAHLQYEHIRKFRYEVRNPRRKRRIRLYVRIAIASAPDSEVATQQRCRYVRTVRVTSALEQRGRAQRPLWRRQFSQLYDRSWPVVAGDDSIPGIDPLLPVMNVRYPTSNRRLHCRSTGVHRVARIFAAAPSWRSVGSIAVPTRRGRMAGTNIAVNPIHLGLGAAGTIEPAFTGSTDWYAGYVERRHSDGVEGRLVSTFTFKDSWSMGEMHPNGAEVVLCLAGSMTLHQERLDGSKQSVVLGPWEYAIKSAEPGTRPTSSARQRHSFGNELSS